MGSPGKNGHRQGDAQGSGKEPVNPQTTPNAFSDNFDEDGGFRETDIPDSADEDDDDKYTSDYVKSDGLPLGVIIRHKEEGSEGDMRGSTDGEQTPPRHRGMARVTHPDTWNCPACTFVNRWEDYYCGMCQMDRDNQDDQPPVAVPWMCTNCRFRNNGGDYLCILCRSDRNYYFPETPPFPLAAPCTTTAATTLTTVTSTATLTLPTVFTDLRYLEHDTAVLSPKRSPSRGASLSAPTSAPVSTPSTAPTTPTATTPQHRYPALSPLGTSAGRPLLPNPISVPTGIIPPPFGSPTYQSPRGIPFGVSPTANNNAGFFGTTPGALFGASPTAASRALSNGLFMGPTSPTATGNIPINMNAHGPAFASALSSPRAAAMVGSPRRLVFGSPSATATTTATLTTAVSSTTATTSTTTTTTTTATTVQSPTATAGAARPIPTQNTHSPGDNRGPGSPGAGSGGSPGLDITRGPVVASPTSKKVFSSLSAALAGDFDAVKDLKCLERL